MTSALRQLHLIWKKQTLTMISVHTSVLLLRHKPCHEVQIIILNLYKRYTLAACHLYNSQLLFHGFRL